MHDLLQHMGWEIVQKQCLKEPGCGPRIFQLVRFPLDGRDSLFDVGKPFLENGLESPLIFVFILKGKTK